MINEYKNYKCDNVSEGKIWAVTISQNRNSDLGKRPIKTVLK